MKVINSNIGKFYITDTGVFSENDKLQYINAGEEGCVYRYGDKAIKIYHSIPRKRVIDEKMVEYLSDIETKRVLLPEDVLYGEDGICGYYMSFIEGDSKEVYSYEKDKLIEEFSYIYSDFDQLGKKSVAIDDLRGSNYISNYDTFHLVDVGDYYICKNGRNTNGSNKRNFRTFVFNDLLYSVLKEHGTKFEVPDKMLFGIFRKERYFAEKEYGDDVLQYFNKCMEDGENLYEYGARLVKCRRFDK